MRIGPIYIIGFIGEYWLTNMAGATNKKNSRKKPVDIHRVIIVLGSLIVTLSLTVVVLAMAGGQPVHLVRPYMLSATFSNQNMRSVLTTSVPLPERRWDYIIIYQSGGLKGNAADLATGRMIGGVGAGNMALRPGLGVDFHFVVDNAANGNGKPDGNVEVGTAWKEQFSTAPFFSWPHFNHHFYSPYANAVGICLIGNINQRPYTGSQVRSTVRLVRALQNRLGISDSHVKFQWSPSVTGGKPRTAAQAAFSRAFYVLLDRN